MTGSAICPPPSEEQREALQQGIIFARAQGFLFSVRNPDPTVDTGTPDWLHEPRYRDTPVLPQFEIDPASDYRLMFVQAPILDARRRVAFVIGLQDFARNYTGAEVLQIGKRLCESRDRIAAFMTHAPKS